MAGKTTDTHPLMAGIRCAEINQPDWPRTLHDKQLTGFSPLALGMSRAPSVWQTIDVQGEYRWVESVETPSGACFLVNDNRLALYAAADGRRRWLAAATLAAPAPTAHAAANPPARRAVPAAAPPAAEAA